MTGPRLFVAAVVVHVLLIQFLGPAGIVNPKLDSNVYLDLAQNLWREGRYDTGLGKVYPPVYPMVLSPFFAIESNALRFNAIYTLHGVLLAAASLALLPLLRDLAGERRAWSALAAAQLLAGVTLHARNTRTEALFTALVLVSVGLAYRFAKRPDARSAAGFGLVLGLMVATRRTGLAFVAAGAALLAGRALWAWRTGGDVRDELRWVGFALAGAFVGFAPELIVSALREAPVQAYGEGVATGHLSAATRAIESPRGWGILYRSASQHLLYYPLSSAGLALLVPAALVSRRAGISDPVRQAVAFVAAGGLALAAMSTLHVVRYWLKRDLERGWDLYPRYLDPMEPVWLLVGFGLACAWAGDARSRRLAIAPWLVGTLVCVYLADRILFPRGGRLPWPLQIENLGWPFEGKYFLQALCVLVVVAFAADFARGTAKRTSMLLTAVALSWMLSAHLLVRWARLGLPAPDVPELLTTGPLRDAPTADVAVLIPPEGSREAIYPFGFKTDHRLVFLRAPDLPAWEARHPAGYVLEAAPDDAEAWTVRPADEDGDRD